MVPELDISQAIFNHMQSEGEEDIESNLHVDECFDDIDAVDKTDDTINQIALKRRSHSKRCIRKALHRFLRLWTSSLDDLCGADAPLQHILLRPKMRSPISSRSCEM